MDSENRQNARATSRPSSPSSASRWLLAALLLVVVAIGVFAYWFVHSRNQTTFVLTDSPSSESAAGRVTAGKRSPLGSWDAKKDADAGRPLAPPMALPPKGDLADGKAMTPLPGAPQIDPFPDSGNSPGAAAPNAPWPAGGQSYRAQHKKGFGGCWGELLLGADRLVFTCADNPGKNLVLTLSQITRVDDDGVAVGGEKYHFDIPSVLGKRQVHELFGDWISRTRAGQPVR